MSLTKAICLCSLWVMKQNKPTAVPPVYFFFFVKASGWYTEHCHGDANLLHSVVLFERCLDATVVSEKLQWAQTSGQMGCLTLSVQQLNCECQNYYQCKRTQDEKCHCLNLKAHNPKISCCKASTVVSCETNSTSVEAARVSAFHIVKAQKPWLSVPFENDWQYAVRDTRREPGRFLWGHVTSKLFIWTVCPQSAADGTKWVVKMEHGAVMFGIQMQRELRCSSTSSASVFHLSHLHISVECICCSEGVVYSDRRNLYPAVTSTDDNIFKNGTVWKAVLILCKCYAIQSSTFLRC